MSLFAPYALAILALLSVVVVAHCAAISARNE